MTNLDAKEILRLEYLRIVDRLGEVDPVSSPALYRELLDFIDGLYGLSGMSMEDNAEFYEKRAPAHPVGFTTEPALVGPAQPYEITTEPEDKAEKPEPSVEEYAPPVMNNPEPVEGPKAAPALTKEVVRAALAKARKSGVNVTELLGELGYDNFSAVPAAKYGEIMERIG